MALKPLAFSRLARLCVLFMSPRLTQIGKRSIVGYNIKTNGKDHGHH